MCTTAAPAFAASSAEFAISAGVTGTAGFFDGVSKEPVSAQVMTVFRDIFSPFPARVPAIPPPALRILRIQHDPAKWTPVRGKDHAQTRSYSENRVSMTGFCSS